MDRNARSSQGTTIRLDTRVPNRAADVQKQDPIRRPSCLAIQRCRRRPRPLCGILETKRDRAQRLYDDQMLRLPDGRIALVDFEEAGPGDPMLDVGNCLAHLKWADHFNRRRKKNASGKFNNEFKSAALERFQWNLGDLAMREAVCLFRICTNTSEDHNQIGETICTKDC